MPYLRRPPVHRAATYQLELDQAPRSRAILFDHDVQVRCVAQQAFAQLFPQPG